MYRDMVNIMQVFSSRFTPGVKGFDVHFLKGEVVKYQMKNGDIIDIIIDSERMKHEECENYGYEAIYSDDGKRYFADGGRIIDWEGKIDTMEQLETEIKKQVI